MNSSSYDKTVKVWDLRKGEQIYTLSGHEGATSTVNYSTNGEYFATGAMDAKVILWKSNSLTEGRTYMNSYNEFPKQFLKRDKEVPNVIAQEMQNKRKSESISEELSTFFERMVHQMEIITRTLKSFDSRVNKIEGMIEELNISKTHESNRMAENLAEIRDEYQRSLNMMNDMKQSYSDLQK